QRRSLAVFGPGADFVPQTFQEADVGAQFLLIRALRCGAHDETAVAVLALALNDPLQALALFFGSDFARYPGVIHRRHVDQETSGQRDMAGYARAFLADRLFRDLHQYLLTLFEQIADLRQVLRGVPAEAPSAAET